MYLSDPLLILIYIFIVVLEKLFRSNYRGGEGGDRLTGPLFYGII